MTEETNQERPENASDRIRKAFAVELDRFSDSPGSLKEAEKELRELQEVRIKFLGKKSELATRKKMIGSIEPKLRRDFALVFQSLEQDLTRTLNDKEQRLKTFILRAGIERDAIDVTIPGRRPRPGHLHPITLMRQRIEDIFVSLGYAVEDDREIETRTREAATRAPFRVGPLFHRLRNLVVRGNLRGKHLLVKFGINYGVSKIVSQRRSIRELELSRAQRRVFQIERNLDLRHHLPGSGRLRL